MFLLVCVAATLALTSREGEGRSPYIEPAIRQQSYASPLGEFSLEVAPPNPRRDSSQPTTYVLTRAAETIWSDVRAYTLSGAVVLDDGWVAGVAFSEPAADGGWQWELRIIVLDNTGEERMQAVHACNTPPEIHLARRFHAANVREVLVNAHADVLYVRIDHGLVLQRYPVVRIYDLRLGVFLASFSPSSGVNWSKDDIVMTDIRVLPDTPLLLVHAFHEERDSEFFLVDCVGNVVWQTSLEDDLAGKCGWSGCRGLFERSQAVVSVGPGRFTIRRFKDDRNIEHLVARDALGTWTVTPVEARPSEFVGPP